MKPSLSCACVVPIPGKGNGIISTQSLLKGHIILSCSAWVCFIDDSDCVCLHCLTDCEPMYAPTSMRRCQQCKRARFCSQSCREMGNVVHTQGGECALWTALRSSGINMQLDEDAEDVETVATLWNAVKGGVEEEESKHVQLFWQLSFSKSGGGHEGHEGHDEEDGPIKWDRVASKVNALKLPNCPPITGEQARQVAWRELLNSFGIDSPMREGESTEDGEPDVNYLGRMVVPEASFFNHSCDANVSRIRVGRRMVFFANRPIAEGEECCITYSSRGEERKAFLWQHYGFHCGCVFCATGGDPRLRTEHCPRCGCEIWVDDDEPGRRRCLVCDAESIEESLKK